MKNMTDILRRSFSCWTVSVWIGRHWHGLLERRPTRSIKCSRRTILVGFHISHRARGSTCPFAALQMRWCRGTGIVRLAEPEVTLWRTVLPGILSTPSVPHSAAENPLLIACEISVRQWKDICLHLWAHLEFPIKESAPVRGVTCCVIAVDSQVFLPCDICQALQLTTALSSECPGIAHRISSACFLLLYIQASPLFPWNN